VVNRVAALRFFFVKTLKRHQFRDFLPYPQDRRRLPTVLSREEVTRLINAAGTLFRRTLLMTLYGTGMRRAELASLKVSDIDSQRMIIRVVAGKGGMLGVVAFKSPFRSYLSRDERVRKNSAGVAIRSPVRFATACVKCLVLCVSNQSGLLDMAERSAGTSAACLIR
jgi:integrase